MSNLQLIQIIINDLLNGPVEPYKIAQKLLKMKFDSAEIFLTFLALSETNQIKIDEYWRAYLTPPLE